GARQARELLAEVGGDPASSVADPDGSLAAAWDVAGVPETFVVDAGGRLAREWRGVKVPGHVDEVLEFVQSL
ncbi:MAG: peroxiredoxin, partial [Gammaproteobacteria bacterium]